MAQETAAVPLTDIEQREADYNTWFHEQVEAGMREADDPNTVWVSHDDVVRDLDKLRSSWRSGDTRERNLA